MVTDKVNQLSPPKYLEEIPRFKESKCKLLI